MSGVREMLEGRPAAPVVGRPVNREQRRRMEKDLARKLGGKKKLEAVMAELRAEKRAKDAAASE